MTFFYKQRSCFKLLKKQKEIKKVTEITDEVYYRTDMILRFYIRNKNEIIHKSVAQEIRLTNQSMTNIDQVFAHK